MLCELLLFGTFVGVPLAVLMLPDILLPAPPWPRESSSILGVTGGLEGGGLQGGTTRGSGERPLLTPWFGDLQKKSSRKLRIIIG